MANTTDTLRVRGLDWIDVAIYYNSTSTTIPSIPDGEAIRVKATVSRQSSTYGNTTSAADTDYASFGLLLTATDANGDTVQINGMDSLVMVGASGVSTTDDVVFTLTGKTAPFALTAVASQTEDEIKATTGRTYYASGSLTGVAKLTKTLTVTAPTAATLARDTNFTITVRAEDGNGNLLSTATDTITVALGHMTGTVGSGTWAAHPTDTSDVFTSPTPDAESYTASLVAGVYTLATQQITGGSGSDTRNAIKVSASGFASGYTGEFAISTAAAPTIGIFCRASSYNGNDGDSSYAAARTACDACTTEDPYQPQISNYGGTSTQTGYAGEYFLRRGGLYATGVDGQTTLTVHYEKAVSSGASSVNIQIRYSNAAPSSGADLRSAVTSTLVTDGTIAVAGGQNGATGTIDASAAIDGTDDIYIWAIAECDMDDAGYPSVANKYNRLKITQLEFA